MMKHFVFAAALLVSIPAWAGSMTFSAAAGAACPAPSATSKCTNLTDAEAARVLAWGKATYGQICDTAEPPVCRDRTNSEVLDAVATGLFRGIRDNVLNYERELARKPAGDAVMPIGVP